MTFYLHYLPAFTTLFSIYFATQLWRHWRHHGKTLYVLWWFIGVIAFGAGTLLEFLNTVLGWHVSIFKLWYIAGALLGGAPLAQGTVYLLLSRRTAHILTGALLSVVTVAAVCVLASPINPDPEVQLKLTGAALSWQWVRLFSPFINSYAFLFLVGGALWSAWQYFKMGPPFRARFLGNLFIAIGALLPGIGGASARFGHIEVLYVTEFVGLIFIWFGYTTIVKDSARSMQSEKTEKHFTDNA